MAQYDYKCDFMVRDYEIDMQGIVHHSVYINYLEHCRSMYILNLGIDVHKYHDIGYDLVVTHLAQDFKSPLRPKDEFYVTANIKREGKLKIIFDQEIRRTIDNSLILIAKVISVCLNNKTGKPCMPDILENSLKKITIPIQNL